MDVFSLMQNYIFLKEKEREIKEKLKGIKEEIEAYMNVNKVEILETEDYDLHRVNYTKRVFDVKRFKKDYSELYEKYCREITENRLVLKKKDVDKRKEPAERL